MDRKVLKQRGKALFGGNDLFKESYWKSVLVTLFMTFNFGAFFTSSVNINVDDLETFFSSNSTDAIQAILTNTVIAGAGFATLVASFLSLALAILVISTFKAAGVRYFLKYRKNNPTDIKELFQNFKDKTFLNIAKIAFCKNVFIYLWSLLFLIPGIVKTYEYWAIDYILATRPDIEREEAFRLSKILTKGHKWDIFVLQLSFLGWDILNGFTRGILGVLYVAPYKEATFVEYFSDIRLEALAKGLITPFDIPDYEYFTPEYQNTPYGQGFAQQYNNSENAPQNPQSYGGFAQPNPQTNTQYNPQPFGQPVPPQPPFTPQAPSEAPQEVVESNTVETEFNPATPPETQE